MEKNQLEITVTISKSIQEKQYEPLVVSLSATMMTDNEYVDDDFNDTMDLLESLVQKKFAERNLKW